MSGKSKIFTLAGSLAGVFLTVAIAGFIRNSSISSTQAGRDNIREVETGVYLLELEHERLGPATEAFVKDCKARGLPVPAEVTFSQLASKGFLSPEDAATFSNAEVVVSLQASTNHPRAIWIRVRFADGFVIKQSADGNFVSP